MRHAEVEGSGLIFFCCDDSCIVSINLVVIHGSVLCESVVADALVLYVTSMLLQSYLVISWSPYKHRCSLHKVFCRQLLENGTWPSGPSLSPDDPFGHNVKNDFLAWSVSTLFLMHPPSQTGLCQTLDFISMLPNIQKNFRLWRMPYCQVTSSLFQVNGCCWMKASYKLELQCSKLIICRSAHTGACLETFEETIVPYIPYLLALWSHPSSLSS